MILNYIVSISNRLKNTVDLFVNTVKALKLEQILFRIFCVFCVLQRKCRRYMNHGNRKFSDPTVRKDFALCTSFPTYPWFEPSDIANTRFRFLNKSIEFPNSIDWLTTSMAPLWSYNLHYFQYLHPRNVLKPETAVPIIIDWIAHNPPGTPIAWDPFPTSLRLVNWIKFLAKETPPEHEKKIIVASSYLQVLTLEHMLERHLLANHLFKNIKALLFAGAFFQGPDAARWRAKGIRFLRRELDEQILPDGGHFELSPMYHCMILEDCLDLLNITRWFPERKSVELKSLLVPVCVRMAKFLCGIVHPDGQISLFNDSAFGIELPSPELLGYASSLLGQSFEPPGKPYWSFPHTGYFVMAPSKEDRLIVDCGRIGPDYQPGHAHCDTLSYELSIRGQRIIVDSGVFDYVEGPMRQYVRGTRAHNTITVDGAEQSEMWKAHRVGRRANPIRPRLEQAPDGTIIFRGAHDGYRRLPGRVTHHRQIEYTESEGWNVRDRVTGSYVHQVADYVHIHPDFKLLPDEGGFVIVHRKDKRAVAKIVPLNGVPANIETGWYCPEFGFKKPNYVVVFSIKRELPLEIAYQIRPVS